MGCFYGFKRQLFILAAALAMVLTPQAHAVRFSNQFAEFELPAKWQCNLEGAEWVCQNTDENKKRDAIIVLAAKLKGDLDSLDRYQQYLQGPRVFSAPNGQNVKSAPKYTKVNQINQHPWVDSLHLESEVPGFYTRYLATIKQDIAVLVTYSINKTKYSDYQSQFEDMVRSLKVFRKAGTGLNQANTSLFQSNTAALGTSSLFNADSGASPAATAENKPAPKDNSGDDLMLYGAIIALAVIGFGIIKKRRGGA